MSKISAREFLDAKVGLMAVVKMDFSNHRLPAGTRIKLDRVYTYDAYNFRVSVYDANNRVIINDRVVNINEIDIIEKETEKPPKIVKNKKREENLDKYGNFLIIEMLPDNESIYLSTALRNHLNIDEQSHIGFAINKELKTVYIYKELDVESGYSISDGIIKTTADYRDISNLYVNPILQLNYFAEIQTEFPDVDFYSIVQLTSDAQLYMLGKGISYIKNKSVPGAERKVINEADREYPFEPVKEYIPKTSKKQVGKISSEFKPRNPDHLSAYEQALQEAQKHLKEASEKESQRKSIAESFRISSTPYDWEASFENTKVGIEGAIYKTKEVPDSSIVLKEVDSHNIQDDSYFKEDIYLDEFNEDDSSF